MISPMVAKNSKAEKVKLKYERAWLGLKGVTAVGLGLIDQEIGIIISVESNEHQVRAQIPSQVEGVLIKIETTGAIIAQ